MGSWEDSARRTMSSGRSIHETVSLRQRVTGLTARAVSRFRFCVSCVMCVLSSISGLGSVPRMNVRYPPVFGDDIPQQRTAIFLDVPGSDSRSAVVKPRSFPVWQSSECTALGPLARTSRHTHLLTDVYSRNVSSFSVNVSTGKMPVTWCVTRPLGRTIRVVGST